MICPNCGSTKISQRFDLLPGSEITRCYRCGLNWNPGNYNEPMTPKPEDGNLKELKDRISELEKMVETHKNNFLWLYDKLDKLGIKL